jgi:hypothetical protein
MKFFNPKKPKLIKPEPDPSPAEKIRPDPPLSVIHAYFG